MAATISETKVLQLSQSESLVYGMITGDASYPTGGWTLDPTGSTDYEQLVANAQGYAPAYDAPNKKLMLFQQSAATGALTQVPNATNLATLTINFVAVRPN